MSQPLTKGHVAVHGNSPRRKLIASREDAAPHHAHTAIPSYHGSQGVRLSQALECGLFTKPIDRASSRMEPALPTLAGRGSKSLPGGHRRRN